MLNFEEAEKCSYPMELFCKAQCDKNERLIGESLHMAGSNICLDSYFINSYMTSLYSL